MAADWVIVVDDNRNDQRCSHDRKQLLDGEDDHLTKLRPRIDFVD